MSVRIELRREHSRLRLADGPWILRAWIAKRWGPPDPGALAEVVDFWGKTLGWGLYAPEAAIEVRLLQRGEAPPEPDWLEARIAAAIARRAGLGLGEGDIQTTGYRLINSEGDGLPGLVVDRYGDDLVLQITTAAMAARQGAILDALAPLFRGRHFVLHPEAVAAREGFAAAPILPQGDSPEPLEFTELGLRFRVPAPPSQKTGAYLDQRDNRRRIAELTTKLAAKGPLLDLGCHAGGFAIHAAAAGVEAVGLDQSATILEIAAANAALNGVAARIRWVRGDLFGALDDPALDRRFATIVVDPPKIASSRRDLGRAVKALTACLRRVVNHLADDGLLVLYSCSHHLGRDQLEEALPALSGGASWRRLLTLGPGLDHPVAVGHAAGEYLRVGVYTR